MTCVSLDDAHAYASWLSRTSGVAYRLPSQAEWLLAADGSEPGCHSDRTGRDGTCPVGSHGSSPLGLSDMWGNVWEWVSDCWRSNCGRRPLHGASWKNPARPPGDRDLPDLWDVGDSTSRTNSTGFRVARTLE